ncbi:MAG: hypothetical protein VB016_03795 [Methanomassiliicoccaceae archaeon]|nr:hypothetical protein [Methanomassiliicoccaceae archaeon]
MDIKQGTHVAQAAFFVSAAIAFIGLGLYLMEYEAPGVVMLVIGMAGIVMSFAVLKVAMMSQALIDSKNSKNQKRK